MNFADLADSISFGTSQWQSLPTDHGLGELSDGDFAVEDLMGEAPETYKLHAGDLQLRGDQCIDRPDSYEYYVIDGDLHVEGTLCLTVWDATNIVVVTGDLHAKALVLNADVHLYVLGATTIDGALVADLTDAGYARFAGPFEATCIVVLRGEVQFADDPELDDELDETRFPEISALVRRLDSGSWRD